MPPAKKQKRSHNKPEQADDAKSTISTPASQRLPGEVLQSSFRELGFVDLLRCMRVYKVWRAYLPGNDPVLNEFLFLKSRNISAAFLACRFFFSLSGTISRDQLGQLPHTTYKLYLHVTQPASFSAQPICVLDPRHDEYLPTHVHPITNATSRYLDIINRHSHTTRIRSIPRVQFLSFTSLSQLRSLVEQREGVYDAGSCRDMQVCIPAAAKVDIFIRWEGPGTLSTP
jgi:hypothetical protein